ncbi:MAG: (2Fe-2S)-binding protein [Spirochaetaceae bacterium]|nr:MAG: (2Fe-2S)-binding protein [Spirochaetaceae bacterium]
MNDRFPIDLKINGQSYSVDVSACDTLLDFLRDQLGLTGTKECCVVGECGVCTVIVNGRTVNSCLMLAAEADGCDVLTVEGLATEGRLSPLQQSFLDHGAAQCGFCISGQLMSAHNLLTRKPHPTVEDVQEALAGNLCRCAGYEQMAEAVLDVAKGAKE